METKEQRAAAGSAATSGNASLALVRGRWRPARRPTGTVTFLFTDIVGSTERWERAPLEMSSAAETHDSLVLAAIATHGGYVFSNGGDGFGAAFGRAADACLAAIEAQRRLGHTDWPANASIGVRMGVHTGEAIERRGNYFGPAVNRAARVAGTAAAHQIVVSLATEQVVRQHLPSSHALADLGSVDVAGISTPLQVFALELAAHCDPRPPSGAARHRRRSLTVADRRWPTPTLRAV